MSTYIAKWVMPRSSSTLVESHSILGDQFEINVRPMIDLNDDLWKIGMNNFLDLPAVVVVGDQSSGKSSILEALSGVELPRGKGMVTRCPLVIQMKKGNHWSAQIRIDGGEPIEIPKPSDVKLSILQAQNQAAGSAKLVSRTEISLSIVSPNTPDLTLIDLPGITRIALTNEGQPDDMPCQIRRLVQYYISRPNTLILCVISGNLDIAVNEAVKLAQECDPTGDRTIGVITKPDLIENDNDKRDILRLLNGEIIQMGKGFVMMKCRSNDDCDKYSLTESLVKEREFFANDKVFRGADSNKLSTNSLSQHLTQNLVDIIKKRLPDMRDSVRKLRQEAQKELETMEEALPLDLINRKTYLMGILFKFEKSLRDCVIEGKVKDIGRESHDNMFNQWNQTFSEMKDNLTQLTEELLKDKLSEEFFRKNIVGRKGRALTTDFISFEILRDPIEEFLKDYEGPFDITLTSVSRSIEEIICVLIENYFGKLPSIREEVQELCHSELTKQEKITSDRIKFHLKEEEIVFTQKTLLDAEKNRKNQGEPLNDNQEDSDLNNAKKTRRLAEVYLEIMNRRLSDQIPACILYSLNHELVSSLGDNLQQLFLSDNFAEEAEEDEELAMKRARLMEKLSCLEDGERRLSALP